MHLNEVTKFEQFAEIQGMLCGFICSGIGTDGKSWMEGILGNIQQSDQNNTLQRLQLINSYKDLSLALQKKEFDLSKEFINPNQPLNFRAQTLSNWCHGFLNGLAQAGISIQEEQSGDDVLLILQRMSDISKFDYDKIEVKEEDEKAFMEVLHYIQLAVTQLYQLLNHVKPKH